MIVTNLVILLVVVSVSWLAFRLAQVGVRELKAIPKISGWSHSQRRLAFVTIAMILAILLIVYYIEKSLPPGTYLG